MRVSDAWQVGCERVNNIPMLQTSDRSSYYILQTFAAKSWAIILTALYVVWFWCMLPILPGAFTGIAALGAVVLWLLELAGYAKKCNVRLMITNNALQVKRRYSNSFSIHFWHPRFAVIEDSATGQYLPILRDSMSKLHYHRLAQLVWIISNRRTSSANAERMKRLVEYFERS